MCSSLFFAPIRGIRNSRSCWNVSLPPCPSRGCFLVHPRPRLYFGSSRRECFLPSFRSRSSSCQSGQPRSVVPLLPSLFSRNAGPPISSYPSYHRVSLFSGAGAAGFSQKDNAHPCRLRFTVPFPLFSFPKVFSNSDSPYVQEKDPSFPPGTFSVFCEVALNTFPSKSRHEACFLLLLASFASFYFSSRSRATLTGVDVHCSQFPLKLFSLSCVSSLSEKGLLRAYFPLVVVAFVLSPRTVGLFPF